MARCKVRGPTPMKMRFEFAEAFFAALVALAPIIVSAATAAETFKAHESKIATNRCVDVGGFIFGVGRAISKNGGDSVGFSKARLLAYGKLAEAILIASPWPDNVTNELRFAAWRLLMADKVLDITLERCETVFEKREAPEHYMSVIAVPKSRFYEAVPTVATLEHYIGIVKEREKAMPDIQQSEKGLPMEYEPRGYWEESGNKANETLAEGQFL